jgi:hypothetical protein
MTFNVSVRLANGTAVPVTAVDSINLVNAGVLGLYDVTDTPLAIFQAGQWTYLTKTA